MDEHAWLELVEFLSPPGFNCFKGKHLPVLWVLKRGDFNFFNLSTPLQVEKRLRTEVLVLLFPGSVLN